MEKYYVMYWNDREDYPAAVFEVMADDDVEAEEIARDNGGKEWEKIYPILTYAEGEALAPSAAEIKHYKNSVYTEYIQVS